MNKLCPKCSCKIRPQFNKRDATAQDIADMQLALAAVALDPNLTIVSSQYHCTCECHDVCIQESIFFDYEELNN